MKTQPNPKASRHMNPKSEPRVADVIMAGMREIEHMLETGKRPEELFTVRKIDVPDPGAYTPRQIRSLRESLNVSQAAFAQIVGVSTVLVKSWEQGARTPSPLARRLLDLLKANPRQWLNSIQMPRVSQKAVLAHR